MARKFVDELEIEIPVLLDTVDDIVGTAYAAHPDRLYLVSKDGKIAYAGGKGPRGFKPTELRAAILKETGQFFGQAGFGVHEIVWPSASPGRTP